MVVEEVSGVLFQMYGICKRQVWLMAHKLVPDQENTYMELGKLIGESSFNRDKKKIMLENIELDIIRSNDGDLVIGEVKKSSKALHSARLQLSYYLYRLKQKGIQAKGLLLVPKEKKKEEIILNDEREREIVAILNEIYQIMQKPKPQDPVKIRYCKSCAYLEFCWA